MLLVGIVVFARKDEIALCEIAVRISEIAVRMREIFQVPSNSGVPSSM